MAERTAGAGLPGGRLPVLAERELYLEVLAQGGRITREPADAADRSALAGLLAVGLLVADTRGPGYTAVDPRRVSGRISAELRSEGTRLLLEAEQLPQLMAELSDAYERAPRRSIRSSTVRHLDDPGQIVHRMRELEDGATEEILLARPGGPLPPDRLELAVSRAHAFAARGGTVRALYEPSVRTDPATVRYAAAIGELGMEVRVLGEPFKRMMIFDRRVAVVPAAADHSSAAFVEDPAVVGFLTGGFERDWQRAERVKWGRTDPREVGHPIDEQVGRLLATGLTQRTIAVRLGLSERTVAGHISRLRELHSAGTLFQLGWLLRGERDE
ncbi:LuxR C-terminal-related transcriptional regulator [Kitasatospora sp. NPDC002040]|uniref:LuxR C-terminal-related transcriptional regulator n=1 Tax=Kitasatospora sp. NPDC002040 TaxID=3154661 RepID=UPI003321746F